MGDMACVPVLGVPAYLTQRSPPSSPLESPSWPTDPLFLLRGSYPDSDECSSPSSSSGSSCSSSPRYRRHRSLSIGDAYAPPAYMDPPPTASPTAGAGPSSSSSTSRPPPPISPKARASFHPLTISPLSSPLASPLISPRSALPAQNQPHARHHSHPHPHVPHAARRKTQSAWSSRSNSPSRAAAGYSAAGGGGGGGAGGAGGASRRAAEGEGFGNRPRSKSHASLSYYFASSPTGSGSYASPSPGSQGQGQGQGYGFPRPPTQPEPEDDEYEEDEGEETAREEPRDSLLFSGRASASSASSGSSSSSPLAGFPRVRSMTDMPTLASFPPSLVQPPAYTPSPVGGAFGGIMNGNGDGPGLGGSTAVGGGRREELELRLLNRGRGGRRIKPIRSDTETETEPLPTARIPPPKTDKPPLARRLVPLFMFFCRGLSIVPAVLGTAWHLYLAYKLPWRWGPFSWGCVPEGEEVRGMGGMDHAIVCLWSIATGVWCYLLASGLLRRWLTYYTLFPTLIRQLSLQAICWSSTHLTLRTFGPSRPLTAWVLIGTTTSISHSVQIWVTSNIRLASKDERESKRWFAVGMGLDYWLGKRKIDWGKVVRQSGVPLFVLYFVTGWTVLLDRELEGRGRGA